MNNKQFIQLPGEKGMEVIFQDEIISISSNNKIISFTFEKGGIKTIRGLLDEVEKNLSNPCLKRCHQSHIVNLHKIKEVAKLGKALVMCNDDQIPVSRSHKKSTLIGLDKISTKF